MLPCKLLYFCYRREHLDRQDPDHIDLGHLDRLDLLDHQDLEAHVLNLISKVLLLKACFLDTKYNFLSKGCR